MLLWLVPAAGAAQAQYSATVTPDPVRLTAGGGAQAVRVGTTIVGAFREPIVYSFTGFPAGITTGAAQTVLPPYPQVAFGFSASAGLAPGSYTGTLVGSSTGGAVSVPVTVVVTALTTEPAPIIHNVSPPTVTTGSSRNVLRLRGENFAIGALVTALTPGVTVTSTRIISAAHAEVTVAVRADARPGRYELELGNPGGATTTARAALLVQRAGALSAPLAVNAVRILSPRPTQIMAPGDRVHAQALIATSGMGTIAGTWTLDGVPFERFTRVVSGSRPIEVRSNLPVPVTNTGEHRLQLVIDHPRTIGAHEVQFFQSRDSRTTLRIIAPASGAQMSPADAHVRWTLVPGAAAYDVEIAATGAAGADPPEVYVRRTADTHWRPPRDVLDAFGAAGGMQVRVRAVFVAGARGAPTPWTAFTLAAPGGDAPPSDDTPYGDGASGERASSPPGGVQHGPYVVSIDGLIASGTSVAAHDRTSSRTGVQGVQSATQVVQDDAPPAQELLLSVQGAVTTAAANVDAPPTLTRLQLSTQSYAGGAHWEAQATGDLSASHDLGSPWDGREESRHWVARAGAAEGARVRPEILAGYAAPAQFDRSELLAVAGARPTGVQGSVVLPLGRMSVYRTVDMGGATSAFSAPVDITAAALEGTGRDGRFIVRAMALQATEHALDAFTTGGRGRAAGALAALDLGPRLQLTGEAAVGEYDPEDDTFDVARDGFAVTLGAAGTAAGFGYALRGGHTGEGFVNPANRGFTPAGVSGLTRGELSVDRLLLERVSASVWLEHARGGVADGAGDPRTSGTTIRLSLGMPVSESVNVMVSGNVSAQTGDAVEEWLLPAVERSQRGADIGLSAVIGGVTLQHNVVWQSVGDRAQPAFDQDVAGTDITASGTFASWLGLSAGAGFTRIEADAASGSTDQLLLTLQPTLRMAALHAEISPRVTYSRTSNSLEPQALTATNLGISARWTPSWAGGLLGLELDSGWTRQRSAFEPLAPFVRRTLLTLGLNWRGDHRWQRGASNVTR